MLYIESPAGVGYSVGEKPEDMVHTDQSTAEDALAALLDFYRLFPEFLPNKLYISGESYAGIYVPFLALQIHNHNQQPDALKLPLKGFLVGNGCTNWDVDVT